MRFLVLVLLLSSFGAHAAERPVFAGVVSRTPGLEGVAQKLNEALADGFELEGASAIIPPSHAVESVSVEREELRRLLADARTRYADADFEGALVRSDDGIARFESALAFSDEAPAWDLYLELMVARAMSLIRLGRERSADRTLAAVIAQRPSFVPDPGWVPPNVVERIEKVRTEVAARRAGTLALASRPAGAEVIVDGVRRGVTPLNLDDLLPGPHYIAFSLGAHRADEYVVLQDTDRAIRVELGDLRTDASRALGDALRARVPEAELAELAVAIAPVVLVGVIEPGDKEISVLVGRIEGGQVVAVTAANLPDDLSDLEPRVTRLVAASRSSTQDAWADGMSGPDLRYRFLGTSPPPVAQQSEDDEGGTSLWVTGLGLGGAFVAAAVVSAAAIAVGVLYLNQPASNPGGTDIVIDASAFAEAR